MVNHVRRNGSFAPLSAHYYDDDAIISAGERAEVLYTRGLAFSARKPMDGFISELQLTTFRLSGVEGRASRLVDSGLWVPVDGGFTVRSWLKHNASRAEIEEKQRRDAARKRGGQS